MPDTPSPSSVPSPSSSAAPSSSSAGPPSTGTTGARTVRARVLVTLRPGVLDPQGQAIEGALAGLGHAGVRSVRQGKVFEIELEDVGNGEDGADAGARVAAMCEGLLANTVIETWRIEWPDAKPDDAPGAGPDDAPGAGPDDAPGAGPDDAPGAQSASAGAHG